MVAVVGSDSLLAREIRDLLSEAVSPPRVQLISGSPDSAALVAAEEEEAVVMTPLTAENLEGARVAFLAGSPASSRRALKLNPPDGPILIDLTAALEEQPDARLRAPSAEPSRPDTSRIQVIAHPAAIALAMLLSRLARIAPLQRTVVHVFEPASERGQRGLDELQKQNVAVLSFRNCRRTSSMRSWPSTFWRAMARKRWSRWSSWNSAWNGTWRRCWRPIRESRCRPCD